jgi:hypothetical protein
VILRYLYLFRNVIFVPRVHLNRFSVTCVEIWFGYRKKVDWSLKSTERICMSEEVLCSVALINIHIEKPECIGLDESSQRP